MKGASRRIPIQAIKNHAPYIPHFECLAAPVNKHIECAPITEISLLVFKNYGLITFLQPPVLF
jgi:hypothetical protein